MLQLLAFRNRFALRRIDASVLEIARAALLDARIEVRESADGLIASGAARPGAVARRRAASRRICRTGALERRHSAARRVCSSEPYNLPTWLLDVAQALAQHSSASSRVCRDAAPCRVRVLPHARPRHRRARRDDAELLAACARRSTAPRTVGDANTLRLKSTEGQKCFVVSYSSALLGKRHSHAEAARAWPPRQTAWHGSFSFARTGAITGHKVAPINLVEPAAHQIAVAELYRRHRFAKRQLKPMRAGSQRLLFE
jgi:hypothetical protein